MRRLRKWASVSPTACRLGYFGTGCGRPHDLQTYAECVSSPGTLPNVTRSRATSMNYSKPLLSLVLLAAAHAWAQTSPLPQIRQNGTVRQLFVDDKPFLMLAGELHHSSASSVEYMKPIWDKLAALHLNTVIGTVRWELIEPAEGKFDFSLVDEQIRNAQER